MCVINSHVYEFWMVEKKWVGKRPSKMNWGRGVESGVFLNNALFEVFFYVCDRRHKITKATKKNTTYNIHITFFLHETLKSKMSLSETSRQGNSKLSTHSQRWLNIYELLPKTIFLLFVVCSCFFCSLFLGNRFFFVLNYILFPEKKFILGESLLRPSTLVNRKWLWCEQKQ